MGMPVTVEVGDQGADDASLDRVFRELHLIDQTLSPFIAGSEVSRINRGELALEDAGVHLAAVLHLCRLFEVATDGYFSAWEGSRLDPSGLVKGWAIDRAASTLAGAGWRDFFVDAGGDIQARRPPSAEPWRIGIRHPVQRDRVVRVVLGRDLAVATSGTYEKGAHIRDPHTGLAATHWVSFTVVGPDVLEADVLATAALAMGPAGLDFIEGQRRLEAYAIDTSLQGSWTSGFDALCDPQDRALDRP